MLVTMRALSYRQFVLNGAKGGPYPGAARFASHESTARPALNEPRFAEQIITTGATVRPEGNNR
jgi:hypothetical protein